MAGDNVRKVTAKYGMTANAYSKVVRIKRVAIYVVRLHLGHIRGRYYTVTGMCDKQGGCQRRPEVHINWQ